MPSLNDIISIVNKFNKKDKDLIERAYNFAEKAHSGQKRKSGEPYFNHAFATAKNLAELGMDATVIASGFLHDVLEDTEVTEVDLQKEFGDDILNIVKGVTKLGTVKYKGIERNVENLRKFFVSMAEDVRVLVVKLADRLHNIETLSYIRPDKQKRIAMETLELYAPLANRLSMGRLKGRLEDASFKYAYPKEYSEVKKLLEEKKDVNKKYLYEIKNNLEKKIVENKFKNFQIDYRVKHLFSLWKKLQKYEMDIEKIYDIIAIRVIVNSIEDCYHLLGIIHGNWKPLPGRIKDYIATPKPNGYRSIHTTIFTGTGGIVEVQIRTHEMHDEAENGIAAHFAYKEINNNDNTDDQTNNKKYEWIYKLKEIKEINEKPDVFLQTIKMDFFKDRVFVFTPKGDVIDLPEDSSVIDFAYAIHSDIGNHANSAKVNGKIVQLSTKLKNMDIVFVETNKKAHPSSKWLDYAKTTMAKKHINSYLKENSLLSRFLSFGKGH